MDQKNELTVQEVLEMTIYDLNRVSVPMSMYATIGVPVARAIDNINMCLKAIIANAPKKEETNDGIEIEDAEVVESIPEDGTVIEV